MSQPEIKPEKINSPMQLMAAWFVMLILLSGVLLTAASQITEPSWASGYLVVCTTLLILGVLVSVILMLTKFRPNLQDGPEYAQWLKDQNRYSEGSIPSKKHRDESEIIQEKITELKKSNISSSSMELIDRLEDNLLYKVSISNLKGAAELVDIFSKQGYESEIYEPERGVGNYKEHEAIWVGASIPTKTAVSIIKQAVKVWPHLKYMHLSSDSSGPDYTHWMMYIGGATSTAVGRYDLQEWSADEFDELDDMEMYEFHRKIRAKYP